MNFDNAFVCRLIEAEHVEVLMPINRATAEMAQELIERHPDVPPFDIVQSLRKQWNPEDEHLTLDFFQGLFTGLMFSAGINPQRQGSTQNSMIRLSWVTLTVAQLYLEKIECSLPIHTNPPR